MDYFNLNSMSFLAFQSTMTTDGWPVTPTAATVRSTLHFLVGTKDSWCRAKAVIKELKISQFIIQCHIFCLKFLARQSVACCQFSRHAGEASLG